MKIIVLILLVLDSSILYSQNYCLRFRGNGVDDIDRIKIPIDNPHNKLDMGESFTIEFQLRANLTDNPLGIAATTGSNDDWTMGHTMIDRDVFGNGDYGDYGLSLANGRIAFGVNDGSQSYTILGNINVADDQWHHVAVIRNHSNGELAIYVDGQLDVSYITGITGDISYRDNRSTTWPNDPYLVIGAEKHDYDNTNYPSFNGYLDELRISNVVRYFTNYIAVNRFTDDASTVLLYHLDEGFGAIAHDSAYLFDGTLLHGSLQIGGNPTGPEWILREDDLVGMKHDQMIDDEFKIYPNPLENDMFIYAKREADCIVYDVSGRLIYQFNITEGLNIQYFCNIEPGSYFLYFLKDKVNKPVKHIIIKK
jgi:hypothetical protein